MCSSDLIDSDNEQFSIITSIMKVATSLRARIVFDGVETLSELNVLKDVGGHEYQGILLGRPLSMLKLRMFLISRASRPEDSNQQEKSDEMD